MLIFLEDNELVSLTFIKDPEAILYPIKEPSPKDLILNSAYSTVRMCTTPKTEFVIKTAIGCNMYTNRYSICLYLAIIYNF